MHPPGVIMVPKDDHPLRIDELAAMVFRPLPRPAAIARCGIAIAFKAMHIPLTLNNTYDFVVSNGFPHGRQVIHHAAYIPDFPIPLLACPWLALLKGLWLKAHDLIE